MNRRHTHAYAQFRLGTAPIMLELARYTQNGYVPPDLRTCPCCGLHVEDETHVLIQCNLYKDIRILHFNNILERNPNFIMLTDYEKAQFILSDEQTVKINARYCYDILQRRQDALFISSNYSSQLGSPMGLTQTSHPINVQNLFNCKNNCT